MRQASHRRNLRFLPAGLLTAALLLAPLWILPVRQVIFISQVHAIRQITNNYENHDNYDNHDHQYAGNTPNRPNPSPLVKLTFTSAQYRQLHFERDGREFLYRGMMYDIASMEESDGTVTVHALPDEKETGLLAAIGALDKDLPAGPGQSPRMGFMAYYPLQVDRLLPLQVFSAVERAVPCISPLKEPCILILTPPPQFWS